MSRCAYTSVPQRGARAWGCRASDPPSAISRRNATSSPTCRFWSPPVDITEVPSRSSTLGKFPNAPPAHTQHCTVLYCPSSHYKHRAFLVRGTKKKINNRLGGCFAARKHRVDRVSSSSMKSIVPVSNLAAEDRRVGWRVSVTFRVSRPLDLAHRANPKRNSPSFFFPFGRSRPFYNTMPALFGARLREANPPHDA